ncbi:hypothetical protein TI39_contig5905g00004 [Zymoseptoria brevis]|uniref:Apple domain-containing protein n=1 Tax=Zymoseptoria brevis TaxID=1047168 RepID=A0A0F4G525_9PEZI|nr:hypothetical protein TI39_contig5905g00004 [Zymoseptoria brevis]
MATSSLRGNAQELDAQDLADSYSFRKDPQHGPNNPVRKSKKKQKHRFPGYKHCDPVDQPIRRHTRHEFGAKLKFQVPNDLDMAYWEALTLVNDVQSPYERFASPLCLKALNCAPTVFYEGETAPVVHALFQRCRTIKVQIKLVRDAGFDSAWDLATVMLRDGEQWIPFDDYLKVLDPLCEREKAASGEVGYAVQFKWWRSLKKPFWFYDLPPEIGETIILYTLGAMGLEMVYPVVPPTNLSVRRLNKDLAEVSRDVLWRKTTKVFSYLSAFETICRPVIPKQSSWLQRMCLCLKPLEFVQMFKVEIAPFDAHYHQDHRQTLDNVQPDAIAHTGSVPVGCFLRSLTSLNYLELEPHSEGSLNPWGEFFNRGAGVSDDEISLWSARGMNFRAPPCQKRFMDYVMCYAAEYLQSIKTVRLTGPIKTCIKHKWEDLLNNNAYSTIKPQIEEWKDEVQSLTALELPLRCFCPQTCSYHLRDLDVDDLRPHTMVSFSLTTILAIIAYTAASAIPSDSLIPRDLMTCPALDNYIYTSPNGATKYRIRCNADVTDNKSDGTAGWVRLVYDVEDLEACVKLCSGSSGCKSVSYPGKVNTPGDCHLKESNAGLYERTGYKVAIKP